MDTLLLASLAGGVLGRSPEALMPAFNGGGGSSGAAAAASKLELAWLALRGALFSLEQPTGAGGVQRQGCCRTSRWRTV